MRDLALLAVLSLSPVASAPPGVEPGVLVLPAFQVHLATMETTLWAVARNWPSDSRPYLLAAEVADRNGLRLGTLHYELPHMGTVTVNVRDWLTTPQARCPGVGIFGSDLSDPAAARAALEDSNGLALGSVRLWLTEACDGARVERDGMIWGDWFQVDPSQDFADGGRLLGAGDHRPYSSRLETRYFLQAGPFDGTICTVFAPDLPAGGVLSLTLGIMDQGGIPTSLFGQTVSASAVSVLELDRLIGRFGPLPPFGRLGVHASSPISLDCTYRAEGRYSVTLPAVPLP